MAFVLGLQSAVALVVGCGQVGVSGPSMLGVSRPSMCGGLRPQEAALGWLQVLMGCLVVAAHVPRYGSEAWAAVWEVPDMEVGMRAGRCGLTRILSSSRFFERFGGTLVKPNCCELSD